MATVSQAFNASQCSTASPVATFSGAYRWFSPTNYTTSCNAVDETTGGNSRFLGYFSAVDPNILPKTPDPCQAITLRTVFYKRGGDAWILAKDESHQAAWGLNPFGVMECQLEGTSFGPPGGGVGVRVATTVRQTSGTSFITLPFVTELLLKPR